MDVAVSVVVPCYQVEKYLAKCVDSILNQTFADYEIILVNDGSTDATAEICDRYAVAHSNIRVVHKANGGLSDARNAGMKCANGTHICFIDSDDYIHPDYLKTMYQIAAEESADVVVCAYEKVYETNEPALNTVRSVKNTVFSGDEAVRQLILSQKLMNYAWNKLYRIALFNDVQYPVGKRWEDIGATYKLLNKSKKVVYTDAILYFYLQREGSITASSNIRNSLDQYDLLTERYNDLRVDYPDLKDALCTQLCVCSYNCWSFLQTFKQGLSDEQLEQARNCISFLDENGKMQLKSWTGFENEKYKVWLYFYCRWLLSLMIRIKRR